MQLVLDNGLKVSVVANHSGHLKQVATTLDSLGKEGFMVVSFLGNGCAQETDVSISDGYVSIKNYTDNRLVSEMFRDTLYQKTFYYTYSLIKNNVELFSIDYKIKSIFYIFKLHFSNF